MSAIFITSKPNLLQWRHNEHDGVANHRRLDCLLDHLLRHRSKKTSKLRVTGLCEGNPPVTGGFPLQRASNAKKISFDDVILFTDDVTPLGKLSDKPRLGLISLAFFCDKAKSTESFFYCYVLHFLAIISRQSSHIPRQHSFCDICNIYNNQYTRIRTITKHIFHPTGIAMVNRHCNGPLTVHNYIHSCLRWAKCLGNDARMLGF